MKLESEASKLHGNFLSTHPPVAMRTFVGKAMQSGVDKFAHSSTTGAQSHYYARTGVPQGLYVNNHVSSSVS